MRNFHGIKSQDILLLMKLIVDPKLSQKELAQTLSISPAEISHGYKRLKLSALLSSEGQPIHEACEEFLVHGIKYTFPAELGTLASGIPTAHSKPGFKFVKQNPNETIVWPDAEGKVKGISLYPIHPGFPLACKHDEKLYFMSSLVEMIRSGRAREKNIAAEQLHSFLMERN